MNRVVVIDLDGTLIPGNSFHRWVRWVARWAAGRGRVVLLARLLAATALRACRVVSHSRWKRAVLRATAGVPGDVIAGFAIDLAADARPELVTAARHHRAEGLEVVLATAAPDMYLAPIAALVGADHTVATPRQLGPDWEEARGEAKWRAVVRAVGAEVEIEVLYTDHVDDLPLAQRARRTVLVAPAEDDADRLRSAPCEVTDVVLPPAPAQFGAILVTHDSAATIERAVADLLAGTVVPDPIVVVDSGSTDCRYLDQVSTRYPTVHVMRLGHNVGFCIANDFGFRLLHPDQDLVLVNPDAFLAPSFLEVARQVLVDEPTVGAVGPKLVRADPRTGAPTGAVDSAAIVQSAWGRLRDRGQGAPDGPEFDQAPSEVAALCAAALVVRRTALDEVALDGRIFDRRFVIYKEDIDLSFRLRAGGWRLHYLAEPAVRHCRGWQDRRGMPVWAKRRSLANEWRIWRRGIPGRSRVKTFGYLAFKTAVVVLGR